MSFNFNGPNFRPMIQESQSMKNNGGGGNTGYFQRGKKKKKEYIDVFSEADEKDTFTPTNEEDLLITEDSKFLDKIIQKTKNIVKNVTEKTQKESDNPFQLPDETDN